MVGCHGQAHSQQSWIRPIVGVVGAQRCDRIPGFASSHETLANLTWGLREQSKFVRCQVGVTRFSLRTDPVGEVDDGQKVGLAEFADIYFIECVAAISDALLPPCFGRTPLDYSIFAVQLWWKNSPLGWSVLSKVWAPKRSRCAWIRSAGRRFDRIPSK